MNIRDSETYKNNDLGIMHEESELQADNNEFDLLSRYNDGNEPSMYQRYHPIDERSELNSVYSRE